MSTVARNAVDSDEDESRAGLVNVGVGWHLSDMENDRAIIVDGVGAVELEGTLTHVHRVSREARAHHHNHRAVGSIVGGTRVGRSRKRDVEGVTTISQGLRDACGGWASLSRQVRGVEDLGFVGRGVDGGKIDINVGVGAGNQDRCVGEQERRGVVHAGNGGRVEALVGPPLTSRLAGIEDGGCEGGTGSEGHSERHIGVRLSQEGLSRVSGGTIIGTVYDEHCTIREGNELTHRTALKHGIVLDVSGSRSIGGLGGDAVATGRCWVVPCVDEGPRVVTPGLIWHVGTTAEENTWSPVVGGGEREHSGST